MICRADGCPPPYVPIFIAPQTVNRTPFSQHLHSFRLDEPCTSYPFFSFLRARNGRPRTITTGYKVRTVGGTKGRGRPNCQRANQIPGVTGKIRAAMDAIRFPGQVPSPRTRAKPPRKSFTSLLGNSSIFCKRVICPNQPLFQPTAFSRLFLGAP